MYRLIALSLVIFLASCGSQSQRPAGATNYDLEMQVPQETENYHLVKQDIYDDPRLGVAVNYRDKVYVQDLITLYVYPIPATDWGDQDGTLRQELDAVLYEIDSVVEMGHYQSRTPEIKADFDFAEEGVEFSGKKASFGFTDQAGREFDSEAFVFMAEDKFIKFRTSFDRGVVPNISGDESVREILPQIVVPKESIYMKELREEYRQQQTNQLMQLLLEAVKNSKDGEDAEVIIPLEVPDQ